MNRQALKVFYLQGLPILCGFNLSPVSSFPSVHTQEGIPGKSSTKLIDHFNKMRAEIKAIHAIIFSF
jgi:hypothetical protein